MKKNLSYIDSVHRDGRIWNLSVMVLLMAFPITVAILFSTDPDWKALGLGLVAAWICMIAHNLLLFGLYLTSYCRGTWNPLNSEEA